VTDPERLVYAAAFAASVRANYLGPEPMSYHDAARSAANDGFYTVQMLRESAMEAADMVAGPGVMLVDFCRGSRP
jgi:hypothetical protein